MKVSSLDVTPSLLSILPGFFFTAVIYMIIFKVVFGIIYIKERTPLTERIVNRILCVIPYVDLRILKV